MASSNPNVLFFFPAYGQSLSLIKTCKGSILDYTPFFHIHPCAYLVESNFLPPILPLRRRRGACFGIILFSRRRRRGECNVVRPGSQPASRLSPRGEAKWDNPEGKGPEKERVSQHVKFKPRRRGELAEPRYKCKSPLSAWPGWRGGLRNKKDRLS